MKCLQMTIASVLLGLSYTSCYTAYKANTGWFEDKHKIRQRTLISPEACKRWCTEYSNCKAAVVSPSGWAHRECFLVSTDNIGPRKGHGGWTTALKQPCSGAEESENKLKLSRCNLQVEYKSHDGVEETRLINMPGWVDGNLTTSKFARVDSSQFHRFQIRVYLEEVKEISMIKVYSSATSFRGLNVTVGRRSNTNQTGLCGKTPVTKSLKEPYIYYLKCVTPMVGDEVNFTSKYLGNSYTDTSWGMKLYEIEVYGKPVQKSPQIQGNLSALIALVVVGAVVGAIALITLLCWWRNRRKTQRRASETAPDVIVPNPGPPPHRVEMEQTDSTESPPAYQDYQSKAHVYSNEDVPSYKEVMANSHRMSNEEHEA